MNSLQRLLAQKDLQVQEGRIALQEPTMRLEQVSVENQQMTREYETLKKQ